MTSEWRCVSDDTCEINVYMAGDYEAAKNTLRAICFREKVCVTLTKTDYIYTGGLEYGLIVGFRQYPRFKGQRNKGDYLILAEDVAKELAERLNQWSVMVVTEKTTYWLSRKPENSDMWGRTDEPS